MIRVRFILLLLLGLAAGCSFTHGPWFDPRKDADAAAVRLQQSSLTNQLNPAWLKPDTNELTLGPGDRIDIDLYGQGEPTSAALVGPDGRIYYGLLPGLNVWGLTPSQTRDLLQKELGKYFKNPRVSVLVREVASRRVWVLGRLNTPGIYPLDQPTTVLDAISRAGGLYTAQFTGTTEELADLQHSFLLRRGKFLPVDFSRLIHGGDMTQNIYLEPDDFVFLPSALSSEVYVLGEVMEPRAIAFKNRVTLSSAIASAGGVLPTGYPKEVVIVRGSLTQPQFAVVNLLDILKGKAREVALQPRDIVYVPDKPLEPLRQLGTQIVETFVRTIAANEGSRAAGSATKVGYNLNLGQ